MRQKMGVTESGDGRAIRLSIPRRLRGDDTLKGGDASEWTTDQHADLDPLVTAYWRPPTETS